MLLDKFLWHLPLHRQHRMLAASGITVNRSSLSLWGKPGDRTPEADP